MDINEKVSQMEATINLLSEKIDDLSKLIKVEKHVITQSFYDNLVVSLMDRFREAIDISDADADAFDYEFELSGNEIYVSDISDNEFENEVKREFEWKLKDLIKSEFDIVNIPEVDTLEVDTPEVDEPEITGIPNGNTMSDTD